MIMMMRFLRDVFHKPHYTGFFKKGKYNEGMKARNLSIQEIKLQIIQILEKYLDFSDYKVFFFGSRVTGTFKPESDIDVGIEGDLPLPGNIFEEIKEELDDIPTIHSIDLVDFKKVSKDFKKIALKKIELHGKN